MKSVEAILRILNFGIFPQASVMLDSVIEPQLLVSQSILGKTENKIQSLHLLLS
jgi:hypothetical protein